MRATLCEKLLAVHRFVPSNAIANGRLAPLGIAKTVSTPVAGSIRLTEFEKNPVTHMFVPSNAIAVG